MLNKKKVAATIGIIVIIAIIIVVINITRNNGKTKVARLYQKMQSNKEYIFDMKDTNNYEISIAEKNGQIAIDMNDDGDKVTTLIKDGIEYLILHSDKAYYTYESNEDERVITELLKDLNKADMTGKEEINGKKYKYEEYKGFEGFMTATGLDDDENDVSTRFYFEGNDLAYIKTITKDSEDELLEIKVSYSAPDELFEVPSDYTEIKDDSQSLEESIEEGE